EIRGGSLPRCRHLRIRPDTAPPTWLSTGTVATLWTTSRSSASGVDGRGQGQTARGCPRHFGHSDLRPRHGGDGSAPWGAGPQGRGNGGAGQKGAERAGG